MSKIVLGLATYGRGMPFTGQGEARPGRGNARNPKGVAPLQGACTLTDNTLGWYEIKRELNAEKATARIDPVQMAAYAPIRGGSYWVGFDTQEVRMMPRCLAAQSVRDQLAQHFC